MRCFVVWGCYVVEIWIVKGEWEIIVEVQRRVCMTVINSPNSRRMGTL
jgi:hypothetical protein